jgi:hypothetical protein
MIFGIKQLECKADYSPPSSAGLLQELGILFIMLSNSYSAHTTISHLLGSWDEPDMNLRVNVRTFFEICDWKNTDYPYVINATFINPEGLNIRTQISLYISLCGIFLAGEVIYCLSHRNIPLPSILVVCCLHRARSSIRLRSEVLSICDMRVLFVAVCIIMGLS